LVPDITRKRGIKKHQIKRGVATFTQEKNNKNRHRVKERDNDEEKAYVNRGFPAGGKRGFRN